MILRCLTNRRKPIPQSTVMLMISIMLTMLVAGCATLPRGEIPVDKLYKAELVGMPGVRAWGGKLSAQLQEDAHKSIMQETPGEFVNPKTGRRLVGALALSGGGANGAFGAGFLYGWSKKGTRPAFKLVTGVSTGALIAPFAFLGPEYDEQLKRLYTEISAENILERLGFLKILFKSESIATTKPLQKLLQENIDKHFLEAVAEMHDRGRRLYIGTTHMDADTFVVWNMGLIAKSGHPDATEIFRKVMLASASIPGAFPPVFFEVEADGEKFDEMHTDGSTKQNVFFHAGIIDISKIQIAIGVEQVRDIEEADLYIIRNGQINPEPKQIARSIPDITGRALSSMLKAGTIKDLYVIYAYTKRAGIDFNYVDIPDDFEIGTTKQFDREEMNRLFAVGQALAMSKDPWNKTPPGFKNQNAR